MDNVKSFVEENFDLKVSDGQSVQVLTYSISSLHVLKLILCLVIGMFWEYLHIKRYFIMQNTTVTFLYSTMSLVFFDT